MISSNVIQQHSIVSTAQDGGLDNDDDTFCLVFHYLPWRAVTSFSALYFVAMELRNDEMKDNFMILRFDVNLDMILLLKVMLTFANDI